jgi:uncharacterized membrane protein YdjX (TVP38/TMEM64 family)
MTPSTRATVLFWCQVGLFVTIMGAIIAVVCLFAFWLNTLRFDLEENRARDKAMLQQHYTELQQHHEAMQDHRARMNRLAR